MLIYSDFPAGNVAAGEKVEGLNPTTTRQDFEATEAVQESKNVDANGEAILRSDYGIKMSGGEQKNLLNQQLYEVRKAEIVATDKERRRSEGEQKRKAWDEKLASVGEEERLKLIEERRRLRTETIMRMNEEKAQRMERLERAREHGQNIIIDLEFNHLMSPLEIKSLTRQVFLTFFSIYMHCCSTRWMVNLYLLLGHNS